MEREIKFRAWHPGHGKRFPLVIFYDDTPGDCLRFLAEGQPVEVMQFTGLKDKNGKAIYEGDVIRHQNGTWRPEGKADHEPRIITEVVTIDPEGLDCNASRYRLMMDHIEVIGNIHENPELLK